MAKPGSAEGQRAVSNPFFFTDWDCQFSCLIPKGDNLSVHLLGGTGQPMSGLKLNSRGFFTAIIQGLIQLLG
jgi:hypothetical protein